MLESGRRKADVLKDSRTYAIALMAILRRLWPLEKGWAGNSTLLHSSDLRLVAEREPSHRHRIPIPSPQGLYLAARTQ
jgi:hypothetical protein